MIEVANHQHLIIITTIVSIGIVLRSIVSLYSYSGYNRPPMYGDFEAQRHWQEITINLPVTDWYQNTTDNDLLYWGLDYPPLTAYHSFLMGFVANKLNSTYIELYRSRGLTNDDHTVFMRFTVLLIDTIFFIPVLLLCGSTIYRKFINNREEQTNEWILYAFILIGYPGQILIDNGHFQYNNMSLGLVTNAITLLLYDRQYFASFFFVAALNYKQMELYHALPFFCYLLSKCFHQKTTATKHIDGIFELLKLGTVVILTQTIIWIPWLMHSWLSVGQVIHRIFPLARGIFEDKVSNVWCIVNVFIKIRDNFSNEKMAIVCLTLTIGSLLPSLINLMLNPSKQKFLISLINSSLAFFLFSFQKVVDESDGCGGKFTAIIVSPLFVSKSTLQRHRLVHSAITDELKEIHAFSQKTFSPDEWLKQQHPAVEENN